MFEPGDTFALGANLPWIRYGGDFGANAWAPYGGLAATGVPEAVEVSLARLGSDHRPCLRWFLFGDGRAGIRFDAEGLPLGLDDHVLADVDVAVALAERARLRLVFSLIDFHWCLPPRRVNGVDLQGRRSVLATPAGRAALVDRVLAPVCRRYGSHRAVAAWDVINEPEWVTRGLGSWRPGRGVSRRAMRAFIGSAAEAIHAATSQPVTVGSAHVRWLPWLRGLPLDFYQAHWYDRFRWRWPLEKPVASFGLDKPVVMGELPTRGSRSAPADLLRQARTAGYAGAWLWSLHADDHASDAHHAMQALKRQEAARRA